MQKKTILIILFSFFVLFSVLGESLAVPEDFFEQAYIHYVHHDYANAQIYFHRFIQAEREMPEPRLPKIAQMHRYKAQCFEKLLLFENAILEYQRALQIYQNLNDTINATICLEQLGNVFLLQEKPGQAAFLFEEAGRSFQKMKWVAKLEKNLFQLGELAFQTNNLNDSKIFFLESLSTKQNYTVATEQNYLEGETWFYLAQIAYLEDSLQKTSEYLLNAEKEFIYYTNQMPRFYENLAGLYLFRANILLTHENKRNAFAEIEKAAAIQKENNQLFSNISIQLAKANYALKTGRENEAGKIYQMLLHDEKMANEIDLNTTLENSFIEAYCNFLEHQFNADSALIHLETELAFLDRYFLTHQPDEKGFSILNDFAFSGKKSKPFIDNAIEVSLKMFNQSANIKYLLKAFQYAEYYSMGLLDLSDQKRTDSVDIALAQLKLDITKLLSEIELGNSEKRSVLIGKMNQVELLKSKFKRNTAENGFRNIAAPAGFQVLLDSDELYLKFYETEKEIYRFEVSKEFIRFYTIKKDRRFKDAVSRFNNFVRTPGTTVHLTDVDNFACDAHYLFKLLVPENRPFELIIDWSGNPEQLPFELLLTKLYAAETAKLNEYPFLVKINNIRYSGGVNLYIKSTLKENQSHSTNYAGFAPFSEKNLQNRFRLHQSGKEVRANAKLLAGEKYLGEKATVKNLVQHAFNTKVLQLSTHATVHENHPQLAEFLFHSEETGKTEQFFYYDIFNSSWKNDLVILSACQTGTGKHVPLYGTVSLSDAFQGAGIKSVVSANWLADDRISGKITSRFLQHCKNNVETSKALRQAKLEYLENASDLFSLPYYWAVYSYHGPKQYLGFQPVKTRKTTWITAMYLILLIFYFTQQFVRRQKINRVLPD